MHHWDASDECPQYIGFLGEIRKSKIPILSAEKPCLMPLPGAMGCTYNMFSWRNKKSIHKKVNYQELYIYMLFLYRRWECWYKFSLWVPRLSTECQLSSTVTMQTHILFLVCKGSGQSQQEMRIVSTSHSGRVFQCPKVGTSRWAKRQIIHHLWWGIPVVLRRQEWLVAVWWKD